MRLSSLDHQFSSLDGDMHLFFADLDCLSQFAATVKGGDDYLLAALSLLAQIDRRWVAVGLPGLQALAFHKKSQHLGGRVIGLFVKR